ncbi:GNAT family N-acetyltransferase [Pedobacter yulinensis]|uniref:GNAT family N-acetyltransferase n=1 Tax=Pedobacter yulinensis TaxID=2126353 RepID=A0A2T3HHA4_9SPHI|nr:GNAT family N-acetyltransferase [Pedobacter yulinensis]PST81824.1 GNAT family N-acetyltransferase [Pedobacter yulinensis]
MHSIIHIRELSDSDQDEVIGLILPIQQQEFGLPITLHDQPDLCNISQFYLEPGGTFLGAFSGQDLVGSIALVKAAGETGAIRKMFVHRDFRGKLFGIAQTLIEKLIAHAQQSGIKNLYLGTVEPMKAAHRFYERNGFRRIQASQLPPEFPRAKTDTLFFHRGLDVQT